MVLFLYILLDIITAVIAWFILYKFEIKGLIFLIIVIILLIFMLMEGIIWNL